MKFSYSVLLAVVAAEPVVRIDRKVPPKHPRNRLARLNIFCDYLFNGTGWIKETRRGGLIRLCNKWSEKMEDKVENSDCFFYDENQKPHGGPEPGVVPAPPKNGHHEKWGTGHKNMIDWMNFRKRRSDDCWREISEAIALSGNVFDGYTGNENGYVYVCDPSYEHYLHPGWFNAADISDLEDDECKADCEENGDCTNECSTIERGSGDKKINRLMKQGPWKGARSILTGFRKFGERYLSQCHGHRKGTHMNKRTQFIIKVSKKFLTHCDHEQCNREYLESKKFKWGKKNLRTDYAGK